MTPVGPTHFEKARFLICPALTNIVRMSNKLPVVMVSAALLLATLLPASLAVLAEIKPLAEEQREVDELLAKADSVELRKLSPRVLRLVDSLLKDKGDAAARRYFEKGIEGNAWALEEQLTLGEILARDGKAGALREKAAMVLRVGEDDDVLRRASRLLKRPLPQKPPPFSVIRETGIVLILVPVGEGNVFIMESLRDALAKRLGIKVRIASLELQIPAATRTAKTQWITRTREQVLKTVAEQPALAAQVGKLGFTEAQIRTNDDALIALVRQTTEAEQGATAAEAFDEMLAKLHDTSQWDAASLIAAMQPGVGERADAKTWVLGVTSLDLFGGASNYLFGAGATGKFIGIVSQHRFRAAFNDEAPKRERLVDRLLKQSLSTIGFMLGVPRCNTPECARAFPQSLAEHDQKPSALCAQCREGFEKVLGKNLPRE